MTSSYDTQPLTPGEQLIERWAAEHERPCLHHHHPYQTPGGDPTRRLAGPLAGEGGPAPSGRRQRPSSAEGPPPSADTQEAQS